MKIKSNDEKIYDEGVILLEAPFLCIICLLPCLLLDGDYQTVKHEAPMPMYVPVYEYVFKL